MTNSAYMEEVNFHSLVNRVANQFEQSREVRVYPDVRDLLVELAMPHTAHVEEELMVGNITAEFLSESILTLFNNAFEIAVERSETDIINSEVVINREIIELSMARYCPYLFWC